MKIPNETLDFLKSFGGDQAYLCRNKSLKGKALGMVKCSLDDGWLKNQEGYDLYFYVNGGGNKPGQIKEFRSFFLDFDAGRTIKSYIYGQPLEYRPMADVENYKKDVITVAKPFVEPSYIVETRNGFHFYWVLSNTNIKKSVWRKLQNQLLNYFYDHLGLSPDTSVRKYNQLLRVPGSLWQKKWENLPSYEVKLIHQNLQVRNIEAIFDGLFRAEKVPVTLSFTTETESYMDGSERKTRQIKVKNRKYKAGDDIPF